MPITIYPSPTKVGTNVDRPVASAIELLSVSPACTLDNRRLLFYAKRIPPDHCPLLASSLSDLSSPTPPTLIPYSNTFVIGIIRAFQQDLHLILRPDDMWLAILTQFNFYINAHSEEYRHLFVEHEGKKELCIVAQPEPFSEKKIENFVLRMTALIEGEVKNKKFRKWIMPDFSTTTKTDRAVASIFIMGTMRRFFEYKMLVGCGFPSVTLLGTKRDWEEILRRVGKLKRYGKEAQGWSELLKPVVKMMVVSFKNPKSDEVKDFWLKVAYQKGRDGSGDDIETISGWITAFCFWDETGKRIEGAEKVIGGRELRTTFAERKKLVMGGVEFPMILPRDIPVGLVSVPVKVVDFVQGVEQMTTMTAGLVGMTAKKKKVKDEDKFDCFQPRAGWWMLEDSSTPLQKGV